MTTHPPTITELRPRLYRLRLGGYQAYLWRDETAATLIDSGPAGSGTTIAAALGTLGLARADVKRLVLTHFHDDHAGSAAEVASWGAEVVAHAADAHVIRGEAPGPPPNFTPFERDLHATLNAGLPPAPPARVDHEVDDGDILDFGGGARVVSTPGHTDGSIALHLPEHGVLITGDVVAEHEGQVILGVFNLDPVETAASFRRLSELDAEVACVGHGEPIVGDASARLRRAAAALNLRRAIELAASARAAGDMPFGSLLVGPTGEVLAEDRNTVLSDRDVTAHPELKLARWAGRELTAEAARETTMYTSCEPCPMCRGAIARSGLGRVVFALSGEQLGELRPPGVAAPDAAEVRYDGPALFEEARVPVSGYYD